MSMLNTFIQKEAQLKALEAELASMKADNQLQKDLEFKEKLEALMAQYDANKDSVLKIVAPEFFIENSEPKKTRKPRKLKTYKNPHTGEVIETRGGNYKVLKAWKAEHGGDTVEGWLIEEKEQEAPVEAKQEAPETKQEEVKEEPKQEPPVEAKKAEKAQKKVENKDTVKSVSISKRKELPIGMKPAPKGSKPKFKFVPPSTKSAQAV